MGDRPLLRADRGGWLYVAGGLDPGRRRLVGWAMGESLETSLLMDTLRMALGQCRPKTGLLHHPDRGSQSASEAYRERLAAWNVTPGLSRRDNCDDNAAMESGWRTLKEERVHRRAFANRAQAASAIFDSVETSYNRERLHRALGFMSLWDLKRRATCTNQPDARPHRVH